MIAHMAILPAKIRQRIAFANHYLFDFRNEDGVIARILRAVQTALEIR